MEKLNPHGPPRCFCVLAGGRPVGLPLVLFSLKRPPSPAWAASPQHTHLQAVHPSQPQSSVEASRSSKEATRLIQVRLGVEWGMNLIPCPLLTYHTAQHHSQGQLGEGLMEVTLSWSQQLHRWQCLSAGIGKRLLGHQRPSRTYS